VFNVADSAIVVGAILLFITQWREGEPADEVAAAPAEASPPDSPAETEQPHEPPAGDR
jgi:hypothetical protein